MAQVLNIDPEDLSRNDPQSKQASGSPAIGISDHAALVEAIRLNFPEIYQYPNTSEDGQMSA